MRTRILSLLVLWLGLSPAAAFAGPMVNFLIADDTTKVQFQAPLSPTCHDVDEPAGFFDLCDFIPALYNDLEDHFISIGFYTAGSGGFSLQIFDTNDPGPPSPLPIIPMIDQCGEQLFTGSVHTPTFKTGSFAMSQCYGTTSDFDVTISRVPTPAPLALLGAGLLGLAMARRHTKRVSPISQ